MSTKNKPSLFGVPTSAKDARVILIPVPWDVTTSYGGGTSRGPESVLQASPQIDLFDIELGQAYTAGYHLENADPVFFERNESLRPIAKKVIEMWDTEGNIQGHIDDSANDLIAQVNQGTQAMVDQVKKLSEKVIHQGKIPAVLGGDHSTPLGLISALSDITMGDFGILHIDAHADLRKAYHGFIHSHASIMRNVMELQNAPARLVQVGIRDFCHEEYSYIKENSSRIRTFFDRELKSQMFNGLTWNDLCAQIVHELPEKVYVSFDIDGLSPEFCPNTGTPVPGGLSFDQAVHLLSVLGKSGKSIIGFDLNEVAPGSEGEWDGNVGSRLLFKLCGWAVKTNGYS